MRLWTVQDKAGYDDLCKKGVLHCDTALAKWLHPPKTNMLNNKKASWECLLFCQRTMGIVLADISRE